MLLGFTLQQCVCVACRLGRKGHVQLKGYSSSGKDQATLTMVDCTLIRPGLAQNWPRVLVLGDNKTESYRSILFITIC